jgi:2-polyprenyl-6-methoxyphenol hydroxylase-like FAD-dependent oxidoreductase
MSTNSELHNSDLEAILKYQEAQAREAAAQKALSDFMKSLPKNDDPFPREFSRLMTHMMDHREEAQKLAKKIPPSILPSKETYTQPQGSLKSHDPTKYEAIFLFDEEIEEDNDSQDLYD